MVVLDTNIVSFLLKGDTRATAYAPLFHGHRLAITFITIAELLEWAETRHWGVQRRTHLEQTLATYLIAPIDVEVCRNWARLRAQRRAKGRPISPQDAWIAAAALRYNITLLTHNPRDFQDIDGLQVKSALGPVQK